ncbi:MAG: ATP-binding protein, partial [Acidimicrobiia bacterium]
MEFLAQPEIASIARQHLAREIRVDPIRLAEAQLLLTEVVANIVTHARASSFRLNIVEDVTGWTVEVTHPADHDISETDPGFGFALLDRIARRWGHRFDGGQLTVWFEVRAAGTGAAVADLDDMETLLRARDDAGMR